MSRPKKTRLQLKLSSQAKARLKALQNMSDADSMAEVVRVALHLYEVVLVAQASGDDVVLRETDGTLTRLVVVS